MSKTKLVGIGSSLLLTLGMIGSVLTHSALAASGQIYLTPATASVQDGSSVTFDLRINPGTAINGVQATVTFDTAKLQYVSAAVTNSAFSAQLQQTQSGSTITLARGNLTGDISTDSLIESITFKALATSGSSAVTLSNANATASASSTYTNPTTANANVNFSASACPSGQTGTPPNCTTPTSNTGNSTSSTQAAGSQTSNNQAGTSSSGGGTTSPSTAANSSDGSPVIVSQNAQYNSVSLQTTSQVPTQMYIEFGTNQATLSQQTTLSEFGTNHNLTIDPSQLTPGETYYYVVVAKDQSGHIAQSPVHSFTLRGMEVSVGIYDSNHTPIKNKPVSLHSTVINAKTDSHGLVTFNNVTPGEHHVVYTVGNHTYNQTITVASVIQSVGSQQKTAAQHFAVVYGLTQHSISLVRSLVGAGIVVLVILGVLRLVNSGIRYHGSTVPPLSLQPVVLNGKPTTQPMVIAAPELSQSQSGLTDQALSKISTPDTPAPGSTVSPITAPTQKGKG